MKEINVHIGEVKIAKSGEVLKALLGSCVGIGMIWKARRVCGLAHCLLAENPTPSFAIGGRYVDQAVRSLIVMMKIKPNNMDQVEVVLAGGGNMMNAEVMNNTELVGGQNSLVAEREIQKLGLRVLCRDLGGIEGRKIILFSAHGDFRIDKIPRIIKSA